MNKARAKRLYQSGNTVEDNKGQIWNVLQIDSNIPNHRCYYQLMQLRDSGGNRRYGKLIVGKAGRTLTSAKRNLIKKYYNDDFKNVQYDAMANKVLRVIEWGDLMPEISTVQPKTNIKSKTKPKTDLKAIIEDYPKGINGNQRYYRIIVGVSFNGKQPVYACYRKDNNHQFSIHNINFDSTQLNNFDFIFTENDFENLLDYLTQIDVADLYTIAEIGKKEIDPFSLLPIP